MLKDKSAVITGSTSGIGLAIAGTGCDIMLNGLGDAGEIESLHRGIEQEHGVRVNYSGTDMTRTAEIKAMIGDAAAALGSVDILVNNTSIQFVAPVDEFPAEKWDAILAIDLSSTLHTTRAALPMIRARSWGRIVNIASAHALVASPYKTAYVAAKHGLLGLTKVIALEVAEQGITCNAICLGYVQTPLVQGQIEDTARARGISKEALMRDVLLAAQPAKRVRAVRTGERLRGLPRQRCGRLDHRLPAAHGRWLEAQ